MAGIPLSLGFEIGSAVALDNRTNVADIAARDALNTTTLVKGILCYVQDEDTYYKWDGTAWVEFKIGGGSGGGPWIENNEVTNVVLDLELGDSFVMVGDGGSEVSLLSFDAPEIDNGTQARIFNKSSNLLRVLNGVNIIIPMTGDLLVPVGVICTFSYDADVDMWYLVSMSQTPYFLYNNFYLGRSDNSDVEIHAQAGTSSGVLRYDISEERWLMSNNSGTDFFPVASSPKVDTVAVDYDVDPRFADTIFVDTTGGAVTVTLPDASLTPATLIRVKKISADENRLTVTAEDGEIDGQTSWLTEDKNAGITVVSDGTDWRIV